MCAPSAGHLLTGGGEASTVVCRPLPEGPGGQGWGVFGFRIIMGIHQKSLFQLLGSLKDTASTCIIMERFEHSNILSSRAVPVRSAVPLQVIMRTCLHPPGRLAGSRT